MKINTTPDLSRRRVLKSGTTLLAMSLVPGGMILGGNNAWAAKPTAVSTEIFATLVQACRDIYPHDDLTDSYYAKVVESFDAAAAKSEKDKAMFENGAAELDKAANAKHGNNYRGVGWERDRVSILIDMESKPFFQKMRGDLVTGIYNNKDVWAKYGYEGESASKGGYLTRGFDDIYWLDNV